MIAGAVAWWISSKARAVLGLQYVVNRVRFNLYPNEIRIEATIKLTNTGATINLERIKGTLSVNGKPAASINQGLRMAIKKGSTLVPLNIGTNVQNLQNLLQTGSGKLQINFTGLIEAEGLKIPIVFNYVP